MQFKNLDEIDRKILNALSENGRLSNAELGRLLNLTRAARLTVTVLLFIEEILKEVQA